MSFIADRIKKANPSPTLAITALAGELKAQGKPVIALSAGEPDYDTWEEAKKAGIAAIEQGKTRYTPVGGTPELKAAIGEKFKRDNGLTYKPNQILVGCGGKQVLFEALFALLNPGDEVIIPAPYWVSYPEMVELCGGKPVIIPAKAEDGFKVDASVLEAAITPKTKIFIHNSPSNPTGATYSREELKGLTDVLVKRPNVFVISDDIYEHIRYGGEFVTPAQIEPRLMERTLTVNGVSKTYAMTGWRIGYGAGPVEVIKAMETLQSQITSNPCSISQAAAAAALNGSQERIKQDVASFQTRRDFVVDRLNGMGFATNNPGGAFYVFPSMQNVLGKTTADGAVISDDDAFAKAFLKQEYVAVVHGSAFGMQGFFRISYATSMRELEEALNRLSRFQGSLKDIGLGAAAKRAGDGKGGGREV